jgi:hypothetical protein
MYRGVERRHSPSADGPRRTLDRAKLPPPIALSDAARQGGLVVRAIRAVIGPVGFADMLRLSLNAVRPRDAILVYECGTAKALAKETSRQQDVATA